MPPVDPASRSARLELALLDTYQGRYDAALKDYDLLLKQNPQDPSALLGKARISFYQGKLPEAHTAATEVVARRPDDFSSVFLLASIEHAEHHRRKTLNLLDRANKLSPGDARVASLRNQVLSESRVTLTTTVAYAVRSGRPASRTAVPACPTKTCECIPTGPPLASVRCPEPLRTFRSPLFRATVPLGRCATATATKSQRAFPGLRCPTTFSTGSPRASAAASPCGAARGLFVSGLAIWFRFPAKVGW